MWEAFGILKKKEMNYIIIKELHEDGTPHIHVYLEFPSQRQVYSRDKLHVKLINVDGKEVIQEGKYESVRSSGAVIEYVLKDDDKGYITNMSLPIVDGVVYGSPEEHLLAVLETEGYEAATNILSSQYKTLFAKKAASVIRNLQAANRVICKQISRKNIKTRDIKEFEMPEEVLDWKTNLYDKKTLILFGPSGTGKTEFSKSVLKSMNLNTIFIRDTNAVKELDAGIKNPALLFDDVSLSNKTREQIIHILDLENTSQLRILYAITDIPSGTPRVFTTNKLEDVIGSIDLNEVPKEIARRVHLVNIDKSLIIRIKRSITLTEEIEISNQKSN